MKFFSSRPGELCAECNLYLIHNSSLPLVRYVHKPFVPETCVLVESRNRKKDREHVLPREDTLLSAFN